MNKPKQDQNIPEVIAVREDKSNASRAEGGGGVASSDVLSIYLKGGPKYSLNKRVYKADPPFVILLPKGGHDRDMQEKGIEGIFVLFRGKGLVKKKRSSDTEAVVTLGGQKLNVPLLKNLTTSAAGEIAGIIKEIGNVPGVGLVSGLRRISLLYRAVSEYCNASDRTSETHIHREAVLLRRLIQEWAFEYTPMEKIYENLKLSSAHAETLFRKTYGITPVAYRIQLRLRRARELLVSTQMNVSQIAYEVGYTDPLYFSKAFRKEFGIPPSNLVTDFEYSREKGHHT
jgi:AraC-like DNA-binding protein